jgi:hypothetical protein
MQTLQCLLRRDSTVRVGSLCKSLHSDPHPSAMVLLTGHGDRWKPPFELRQRGTSTYPEWMPETEGKRRARLQPAAMGPAGCRDGQLRSPRPAGTRVRLRLAPYLVVNRDRPSSARHDGPARACRRQAQPARTSVGPGHPRNAEKHPHGDAQPLRLPVGSPASTRVTLPQQTPHAVGLPVRQRFVSGGAGRRARAAAPRRRPSAQ